MPSIANRETYVFGLMILATVLFAAAWIWLLVQAFAVGKVWGPVALILIALVVAAVGVVGIITPPQTAGSPSPIAEIQKYAIYILPTGVTLLVVGLIWLIVQAFRTGKSRGPTALMLLAGVVAAGGLVVGQLPESKDPRVTTVDGEKHITLTRAEPRDYSMLAKHPDAAVVLMANDDVTDETLQHLEGLKDLHKLDLSNTKITDAGLASVAKLPKLRSLYLQHTQVTDEGILKHLADMPTLVELDLTGCKSIKSKTKREWKATGQDRKLVD